MSNYTVKAHNAIMRSTAVDDYNAVLSQAKAQGVTQVLPKGASWQKVEDATAVMIKQLTDVNNLDLNRGINYYMSL